MVTSSSAQKNSRLELQKSESMKQKMSYKNCLQHTTNLSYMFKYSVSTWYLHMFKDLERIYSHTFFWKKKKNNLLDEVYDSSKNLIKITQIIYRKGHQWEAYLLKPRVWAVTKRYVWKSVYGNVASSLSPASTTQRLAHFCSSNKGLFCRAIVLKYFDLRTPLYLKNY